MKPPRLRSLLLALCFCLPSPLLAQAGGSFSLEQVMNYPFPSSLTAAAHAQRIAWAVNFRGVRNIWIADGPDFSSARQLTHYTEDDGGELDSVRLTPDGGIVLFSRGSETNGQGEVADPTSDLARPQQQVWAITIGSSSGNSDEKPRLLGEMDCGQEDCEDIQISPDGKWAVWPARRQLWLAPLTAAAQAAPQVSPNDAASPNSPAQERGRNPQGNAQNNGPAKSLGYIRGDNVSPVWSPDGAMLAFVSARGDHAFIGIYQPGSDHIRWVAPSFDYDLLPRWSPDSAQLAFIRRGGGEQKRPLIPERPVPFAIWVADAKSAEGSMKAREIWRSGSAPEQSLPGAEVESFHFAAGNRIVFGYEADGWNHLYSIAANGGQPTLLTPGQFDVEQVTLSSDGQNVLYTSNQDDIDRRHIWSVPVSGGRPRALTAGETIEWAPVQTGDGKALVCLGSSATTPGMPYLLTGGAGAQPMQRKMIAASSLPSDFPSAQLITPRQVIFTAEDGVTLHGQLFLPRNPSGRMPGLVFMHGGSRRQMVLGFHYMNYYSNAYAENQYLASRGFAVLSVNYRTGIMYGRAFREPADGGWRGASEYKDVVAAGKYLAAMPSVGPARIGLWGGSYGGYLTAMGLARNSDIFKAGVDMHGVHDWSAFIGRRGGAPGDAPDAKEAEELAFRSSPNASISNWRSPVLIIQGDDDRNVAVSQSVDLVQRLRAQKVPFEQIIFPDDIHDFLLWRNWVRAYDAEEKFFQRILVRGEKLPPPE